ncbi:hypothetical protein [Stenotrophomonas sp. CFBP 13718]|uniref:hypothetical protein n=1 Tax=Stenotrophomonas sp. CFBP 13718 TaxID=2775304 RepID=UPI001782EDE6|nr:hypothetical protein [Stenotrophomonas sp. CFBP 13718]MBD8695765.1 hypothetical protein [Stenotrophomonas sp. CFBP 13718]
MSVAPNSSASPIRERSVRPVLVSTHPHRGVRLLNGALPAGNRDDAGAIARPSIRLATACQVMDRYPHAAELFLAGLARDNGPDSPPSTLINLLVAHAELIRQVDERLRTLGAAGLAMLQRRLLQAPAYHATQDVFAGFLSHHDQRSFDRSVCRADARALGGEDAKPEVRPTLPEAAPAPLRSNMLRLRSPLAAATGLLMASRVAPAAAVPEEAGLMAVQAASSASGSAMACGRPALAMIGGALALSGTALLAATTQWRMAPEGDEPLPLVQPRVADPQAVAAALDYLGTCHHANCERLLDRLLWHGLGDNHATSALSEAISAVESAPLTNLVGAHLDPGPWLGALAELELDDTQRPGPVPTALRSIRQKRSVSGPQHPMRPRSRRLAPLIDQCRTIRPLQQTLPHVENALASVARPDDIALLRGHKLRALGGCLAEVRKNLNTLQSRLEGLRQTIAQRDPTPTGIDIPRIAALDRLIKRVERLSTTTVATLRMVNQRILAAMG